MELTLHSFALERIFHLFYDPLARSEMCGVLIGTKTDNGWIVRDALAVVNTAKTPEAHFQMKAGNVRAALGTAYTMDDVIGSVHTHPHGHGKDPSYHDIDSCPEGMVGIVLHQTSGRISWYDCTHGFLGKRDGGPSTIGEKEL